MKQLFFILFLNFLISSCGGQPETDKNKNQPEKKVEKSSKKKKNKEDKVLGSFELTIDGKTYTGDNLEQNYCDITKMYNKEKSSLSVRFKDLDTKETLLLIVYCDEAFLDNPVRTISKFHIKDQGLPRAHITFINEDFQIQKPFILSAGEFVIQEFNEGYIKGEFSGQGGTIQDVMRNENLLDASGTFSLKTKNYRVTGR